MFTNPPSSVPFPPAESSMPVLDEHIAMLLALPELVPSHFQSALPSSLFTDNVHLTEGFRQHASPPYLPAHYPPHGQPGFPPFQPNPSSMPPSSSMSLPPPSPALGSGAPLSPSIRSASSQRFYVCERCPKDFSTKRSLNRHVDSFHKLTKYTCDVCLQELSRKDALGRHKRNSKQCKNILELREKKKLRVDAFLPRDAMNNKQERQ